MTSLHITHTISDFDDWLAAFSTRSDFRAEGGVTGVTVRHGVEDPTYVAVDLEFADAETARAFLGRLETEIWPNSPYLTSTPSVRLLESAGAVV